MPLPGHFSAEIYKLVAACLALSLGGAGGPVRSIRRDASLAQLQAMPDATPVASLMLNVVEQGRMPWAINFAFPLDTLGAMFAHGEAKRPTKPARGPALPTDAPFADMPIDLTAVLVDMSLPLATVSALSVGQVLPVPIARSVPVKIGARTYAHGTIGALDDRVAIQITQLS